MSGFEHQGQLVLFASLGESESKCNTGVLRQINRGNTGAGLLERFAQALDERLGFYV